MKRLLLLFLLILTAAYSWADASGTCGDGVTYVYTEADQTLTISKTGEGNGKMTDYAEYPLAPWRYYKFNKVIINLGVSSIGDYAFNYCGGLTSITIPNSVTSIGNSAFNNCRGLTSITIPNSVTSIGNSAFYGCSGLTSITIPNSVISIGNLAFCFCSSLTSIIIPNSVTSIGDSAFLHCSGLTSITIPTSVISIGKAAFSDCSGLTSVKVEGGNTKYDSRGNCNAIIETGTNTLILGIKNTIIPNSVTSIGVSAFAGCNGLTSITIPNSVTSIGVSAFNDCRSLMSVTIPNGVTSIGSQAFYFCSSLTSIIIPNSVTYIGHSLFYGCSNLSSVKIGNSVSEIPKSAFNSCSSLKTVTIPRSVTDISRVAFTGCTSLSSIVVEDGNPIYDSRNNCNAIIVTKTNHLLIAGNNTVIPNGVTSIDEYAFRNCVDLVSLTIPNSVTSININSVIPAFESYCNLSSIVIEAENTVYDSRENCNAIIQTSNNSLLLGCKNTKIPNSVTSIGSYAFQGCSGLTSITIPNSVTSIGGSAFNGCNLTSVTVRNSTPPTIIQSMFPFSVYPNATLYVPIGSKEAYTADYYWKNFKEIVEIDMAESVVTGDANGDGMVDAADVVAIVNKILDKSGDNFNEKAADVNGDGVIDVSDVVAVVNIILRD